MKTATLALAFVVTSSLVAAEEVAFTAKPTAVKAGEKVTITFAVSAPTDVEVAVVDAKGKVVRHLAAGVLGGKQPPPEPLKSGLSQTLVWDGTDDLGDPVSKVSGTRSDWSRRSRERTLTSRFLTPFSARVRIGMGVKFGRTIGGSPYTGTVVGMPYRAPVNGLAVDAEGNLHVKMMSQVHSHGNSGLWPWHLRQFDRTGTYLKTLLPYPPSTDPAKATGFRLIETGDGRLTPANENSLYPVFYRFGNEMYNRVVDGSLLFVHSEVRQLNFFKLDGSNAVRTVTMWSPKAKLKCPRWLDIQVAISPDGRTAYYSNVAGTAYDGKKPADIDPNWPQGRIYRQDLTRPGVDPERFFDLQLPDWETARYWMPSAWDKKTAAAGIATDAKGNVLVGDLVNQEVVEISPDGRKLSATKVPWPDKVLVHAGTGHLYVVSRKISRGYLPPATLYKIVGRGAEARVAATLQLRGTVGSACTLDESGEVPVLWLAGGAKEGEKLIRVEDRGSEFVVTGEDFLNRDPNAITFVAYMDVDREAELVYVTRSAGTAWRFNGQTGAGGPLKIKTVDLTVGRDGMVYTWGTSGSYHGPVTRFTRDLKPAPLPATGTHTYGSLYGRGGRGAPVCGLDVDLHGTVFATWGSNNCHVRAYDAQGRLVKFDRTIKIKGDKAIEEIPVAIDYVSGYGGSIRVDPAGNLYLVQKGVPKGFKPPRGYERDPAYRNAVGTILKFGPAGGTRKVPVDSGGHGGDPLGFNGLLALYPGCGPISQWRCDGSCACTKPRFDVDDFGRLYVPNAITFSVSVRDNAGNEIVTFGHYGNFDAQGPESAEPKPEIPLGWPVTAGASDRAIYVGDCLNHRVVRVDKTFAGEITCQIE